jgi:ATP-dependent Clp protease ATP-binding subunit ClpC
MTPTPTQQPRMQPIFLVSLTLGILLSVVAINRFNPIVTDILLALTLVGAIWRFVFLTQRDRKSANADVALDFAKVTGVNLAAYATWLKENVRGHDDTVDAVVRQIQNNAKIAGPGRTLGAYLLVGPTGTGKTFLAKLVAEALYPESEPVVLAMNQYKNPADVFTLFGSAPGTTDQPGALTRPVAQNPYRVIILDELEKAHPDIRQSLFDVLDRGTCVEKNTGATIHFSGCVFFATSNGGVEALRAVKGEESDAAFVAAVNRKALGETNLFEKAFLSRWDGIYLMDELEPLTVAEVACLELTRQWGKFGIQVSFASADLIAKTVVKNSEFREYGVRQLAFLIRSATDAAISEAKNRGFKKVRLEVDTATSRIRISTDGKPGKKAA